MGVELEDGTSGASLVVLDFFFACSSLSLLTFRIVLVRAPRFFVFFRGFLVPPTAHFSHLFATFLSTHLTDSVSNLLVVHLTTSVPHVL